MKTPFMGLFIIVSTLASSAEYYVSPTGSDTNPGTKERPFKTIIHAESKLADGVGGNTIYLRAGKYNEKVMFSRSSGTKGNPNILRSYQNERVIIDGDGISIGAGSALVFSWSSYIHFIGLEVRNVALDGMSPGGGTGIWVEGDGCQVSHCTIYNCWAAGIRSTGDYCIIDNNYVKNVGLHNADWTEQEGESCSQGINTRNNSYITIRNNKLRNIAGEGLSTTRAENIVIEDNIIHNAYSTHFYIMNSQNVIAQRNLIYNDTLAGDNIVSTGIGYWNEGSEGGLNENVAIINNIVFGCGRNLYSACILNEILIANNIFINNRNSAAQTACVQLSSYSGDVGPAEFRNNIIIQEDSKQCIYPYISSGLKVNWIFSNNLYNKPYSSAAAGANDIIGDPLFSKISKNGSNEFTADYFKLLRESPAINKGCVLDKVSDDFFGNKRDAYPDIGPHEFSNVESIKVTNISVTSSGGINSIDVGSTLQLIAFIEPSNATNNSITWSIINGTGQATISSTGLVSAMSAGTVTAKATAKDGSGIFGAFAITIRSQVNNALPVYMGSVIENSTPSKINITFSLPLTNLPLSITAFTVKANSVSQVVYSVNINGTKVQLTLVKPVYFGDVLTIAYSKPSEYPLQTSSGQQVASFSAKTVTNKVIIVNSPPVVMVNYNSISYSGFVAEINASRSLDSEKDNLTFIWTVPANISVSTTTGPVIQYLGPVVKTAQTFEFTLNVSDGRTRQTRTIPIEIFPYRPELEVAEIANVEASDYQSSNYPQNIIDGNLSTIWSSNGKGQWLMLEMQDLFSIQHIELAFKSELKEEFFFDVLGSKDKETWESLLVKSSSCGFSGDVHVFDLPLSKTEHQFKFVKLIGNGNSNDNWNYISEMRIFGYRYSNLGRNKESAIKIYPNPAREYVNIRIDEPSLKLDFIRILSLGGNILNIEVTEPETRELQISVNLKRGIYLLQMGLGDMTLFTQKLVIMN